MTTVHLLWFRRDLRLADNPALLAAAGSPGFGAAPAAVVPLFVVDPALWEPAGAPRRSYLLAALAALGERIEGGLLLRRGDPAAEVAAVARAAGAAEVHVAADFGPYGFARDARVEAALAEHGIALVRTGSPYAVAPGRLRTGAGDPYQVFSPFHRAWLAHGWREPPPAPAEVAWTHPVEGHPPPAADLPAGLTLPAAGEVAALARWREFRAGGLGAYAEARNLPAAPATSHLSTALKYGELHPRTLLADLAELGFDRDATDGSGAATFAKELAWREFWADVLFHRPRTAREYLRPQFARMRYDAPGAGFDAWREGRTGFPIVDAGMRQLRAEGWMHNRVRMVVASFLIKDLHVEWQHGAREFMRWLRDGDLASNALSWQWVAGCGTDAAPYFRIFNPVSQGASFDPDGEYVRRYVRELRHLPGATALAPWDAPDGYARGYPARILDHAEERAESLRRLKEIAPEPAGQNERMAVRDRVSRPGAQQWVPAGAGVEELAAAATACEGCELFAPATGVVFSKGAADPRVVLVGEQPGDVEDRQGAPFVGPAGKLLDRAIAEAGLDFARLYATNAVKHFRFVERGPRRLHQTPEPGHIAACRPWLAAELRALDPELVIALGATAGRALVGPSFRVGKARGLLVPWPDSADPKLFPDGTGGGREDAQLLATIHPSAVLRADDRDAAYAGLVADLRVAAEALA